MLVLIILIALLIAVIVKNCYWNPLIDDMCNDINFIGDNICDGYSEYNEDEDGD